MTKFTIVISADQATQISTEIGLGITEYQILKFHKSYLLPIFIAQLKYLRQDILCVNCNSSEERLLKDLKQSLTFDGIVIYYNVESCKFQEKLKEYTNKINVILCL